MQAPPDYTVTMTEPTESVKANMPAWNDIKARYEAGEGVRAIARALCEAGDKISHQAISKRAAKEQWRQPGTPAKWQPLATQTETAQSITDPDTHKDKLLAALGKRTPETAAIILAALEAGQTLTTAAGMAGMSDETLRKWRKEDESFDRLCMSARMASLGSSERRIKDAGARGDWKADQARLSRARELKEEWGENAQGTGTTINVILNIPRADSSQPVVIEGSHD